MLGWFKDCHKLCKGWFLQLVVAISMSQHPDKIFWCWPELLTETKSQFHTGTVAKCTSNPPFLTPVWPWKETETCISWGRVVQYTQSGYMGLSRQMCTDAVYETMVIGPWIFFLGLQINTKLQDYCDLANCSCHQIWFNIFLCLLPANKLGNLLSKC